MERRTVLKLAIGGAVLASTGFSAFTSAIAQGKDCLLYTSDAADE